MRKTKKAVAIQANVVVERIEDDYSYGEIGRPEIISDFELEELDIQTLIDSLCSELEVTQKELKEGLWADEAKAKQFVFNHHRTVDGKIPTDKQIKLWTKGEFVLYTYYYYIVIKRIETQETIFSAKDFSKTIGTFDMN